MALQPAAELAVAAPRVDAAPRLASGSGVGTAAASMSGFGSTMRPSRSRLSSLGAVADASYGAERDTLVPQHLPASAGLCGV